MKNLFVGLLFVGLLAAGFSDVIRDQKAQHPKQKNIKFAPGQVYVYEYSSRLLTGVPQLADQYAGFEITADLILQPLNQEVVAMKMSKIRVGKMNDPRPSHYQEDMTMAHHPDSDYQRELAKPIRFVQVDGKVKSFEADASEPQWSLNMKKSILSLLNVNLNPKKIMKSPLDGNLMPRLENDKDLRVYPIYEEGIGGICETVYELDHIPHHKDETPEPDFVLNVTKTRNYDNCLTEPNFANDNFDVRGCPWVCRKQKSFAAVAGYYPTPDEVNDPYMSGCPCEKEPSQSPVKQYAHVHYNISLEQPTPIIEGIFSEGKIVYHTFGDEVIVQVQQNITLRNVQHTQTMTIPQMARPIRHNELSFRLPKPQLPIGNKAPLDIPYMHLFGQPNTPELIQLVPELLDSLVSDIIAGDVAASKNSLPKAVQVVNALAVLKKDALEELFQKVAAPGRDNRSTPKEKMVRKLFLDALPLCGSNPAAKFIKLLIEANQVTTFEAKEMIEAVPQNIFLPSTETIDQYLELFQNPIVKERRALYASAGIAFGKLVHEAVIKRQQRPGDIPDGENVPADKRDLPAQMIVQAADPKNMQRAIEQQQIANARRMKRSAPFEDAFLQELPTEADLERYIQILTRKLDQADEFHKKVTIIEALTHMGVPQVLKVLEPYVSGRISEHKCPGYQTESKLEQSEECNFLRQVVIGDLYHVAIHYPKQVAALVLPVYNNPNEPYELRTAAFTVLLFAQPEEHVLEKIASDLWRENNKQVSSYVYSALESFGNFTIPCYRKLASQCDNAFEHAQPSDYGMQYSKFKAYDYYDEKRDFGLFTMGGWVSNNISNVPRTGFFAIGQSNGPFHDMPFQFGFHAKGLENLIERALEPNGLIADMFEGLRAKKERRLNKRNVDSAKEALEALKQKLDFEYRTDDEPKATIFYKLFESTSQLSLDKAYIKRIIDEAEDDLKDIAQDLLQGKAAHYVKLMMPSTFYKVLPSEIGLPVIISHRHPIIISLKVDNAKLDLDTHPKTIYPTGVNFTALVQPSVLYSSYVFAYAVDPANRNTYGTHIEKTSQATLPMEVSIGYVRPKNLLTASIIPKVPSEVIYHKTEARTFVGKAALARSPDRHWLGDSKIIKTMPVPFATEDRIGQELLGLGLHIQVNSENVWTKKPFYQSETAKKHGLVPALVEEIRNPGWQYREVHVELEPDQEEPTYGYDFTFRYKWVADDEQGSDNDDSDESSASSESDSDDSDHSSSSKSSESASSESNSKKSKSSESSSSSSSDDVSQSLKKKIKQRLSKLVQSKEKKNKNKSSSESDSKDKSKDKSKSSSESSSESNESGSSASSDSSADSKSDNKHQKKNHSHENNKNKKHNHSADSSSSSSSSSQSKSGSKGSKESSESSSSSSSGSDESRSMEDAVFDYDDVMELILGQDFKKHSIKKIAREIITHTKDVWQWAWDDDEDSSSSDSSKQGKDIVPATIAHDFAMTAVARGPRPTYYAANVLYVHTYDHRTIWVKADGHIKTPKGIYLTMPTLFCADAVVAFPAYPGEFYYDQTSMQTQKAKLHAQFGWGPQCGGEGGIIVTGVMEKTEDQVIKSEDLAVQDGAQRLHIQDWIYQQCQIDRAEGQPLSWACERAIIEDSYLNQVILDIKFKNIPHEVKNLTNKLDLALKMALYESMDNNQIHVNNPKDQIRVVAQYSSRVPGVPLMNLRIEKPEEETQFEKVSSKYLRPISTLLPTKEVIANLFTHYEATDSCALMEDFIRTFDNVTYKMPDNPCQYLLAKDCSPRERFAVFAAQLDEQTKTKTLTAYVAGAEIKLLPPQGQDIMQVIIDGKTHELTFKKPITFSRSQDDIRIYLRKTISDAVNPICVIEAKQDGVEILYDGKNAKVLVDNKYQGKTCGLCGDNNDESEEEFIGPDLCIHDHEEDFANSYALAGEHCQETPKPRREPRCPIKDSSEENSNEKKIKEKITLIKGPTGTTIHQKKETTIRQGDKVVYAEEQKVRQDKPDQKIRLDKVYRQDKSEEQIRRQDNSQEKIRRQDKSEEQYRRQNKDKRQIMRTQYVIRQDQVCFTTRPIMSCAQGQVKTTKQVTVDFHCLQKESPFTQQLMAESETKILVQLANKRVDYRETIQVPALCKEYLIPAQ